MSALTRTVTSWRWTLADAEPLELVLALYQVTVLASVVAGAAASKPVSELLGLLVLGYLLLVPGTVAYVVLDEDPRTVFGALLYVSGLSVIVVGVIGLAMNLLLSTPLARNRVLLAVVGVTALGHLLARTLDRPFDVVAERPTTADLRGLLLAVVALLLSVAGAHLVATGVTTLGLYAYVVVLCAVVVWSGYAGEHHATVVFLVSLSLLLHNDLVSPFVQGADLHGDYLAARDVLRAGRWDPTLATTRNSLLPLSLFVPMAKVATGFSLTWILKFVPVYLFSLVPVGVYLLFSELYDRSVGFYAAVFFASIRPFFTIILWNGKQMFGEFFLICLLLAFLGGRQGEDGWPVERRVISLVFVAALVVSHYSSAVLFQISFAGVVVLQVLSQSERVSLDGIPSNATRLAVLSVVLLVAWYMWVGGATVFATFVGLGSNVVLKVVNLDLFASSRGSGAYWIKRELNPTWQFLKLMTAGTIALSFLGVGATLLDGLSVDGERYAVSLSVPSAAHVGLSLASFGLIAASVVVPRLIAEGSITLLRVYQLTLLWLAPWLPIGARYATAVARRYAPRLPAWQTLLRAFLIVFLLFNLGIPAETVVAVTGDGYNPSVSMAKVRIEDGGGTPRETVVLYGNNYPPEDVAQAEWLGRHRDPSLPMYIDGPNYKHVLASYGGVSDVRGDTRYISPYGNPASGDRYVLLRTMNVRHGIMETSKVAAARGHHLVYWNRTDLAGNVTVGTNRVYTNGDTVVYWDVD